MIDVKRQELEKVQADIADLSKRCDADELSIEILQANITLAVDRANVVVSEAKVTLTRLGELEKQSKDTVHRQSSLRTALNTLLNYLDKVEPTTPSKGTS